MAQPQAYAQAYAQQNRGTLMSGQTIAVNKYTVQVERYLSQGGFAHVYLVRTAQQVYGTTHHVLKRIAVPNESMLTEVKKEVDIMRILKGHPNIVCLIDAAWHRMQNGMYEVFILMEFCPGGGIIDMMNRRLRERLTEPEILTIFVEVCEGLAAMHALKPPLLHRDLKVENILQSSSTSYKLCDFGSATPVQRMPSSMQDLRALEADLNRHTTLQYRAPEMVDVFQRRPIDEKSDIWALGVLLYKLCYYTTPFEEHGPLAILNVQYKIPPYPVYSSQMNALIASMLREHGAQRPSVFEVLNHVHALRGSKPRFNYNLPPKQPVVAPRTAQNPPLQPLSPNVVSPAPAPNPLDDLVSYKSRTQQPSTSPNKNAGIEARDKVLEAIAPMRRGRPTHGPAAPSPPSSPSKKDSKNFALDMKFGVEEERAWRGVRGHKSGMASIGNGASASIGAGGDAWGLSGKETSHFKNTRDPSSTSGFESSFASSLSQGFGDSFDPAKAPEPTPSPQPPQQSVPRPAPSPIPLSASPGKSRVPVKDAFEGLGIASQPPPQTLGEASRARTGTAFPTNNAQGAVRQQSTANQHLNPQTLGSSSTSYRPPSAHIPAQPRDQSPHPQSWKTHGKGLSSVSRPTGELSAEERFPPLEDLDRNFTPSQSDKQALNIPPSAATGSSSIERPAESRSSFGRPPSRTTADGQRTSNLLGTSGTGAGQSATNATGRFEGVRSQQVTGTAMREARLGHSRQLTTSGGRSSSRDGPGLAPRTALHSRPVMPRRHRSSISIKPVQAQPSVATSTLLSPPLDSPIDIQAAPALPPRPQPSPQPRDWLTGVSDDENGPSPPRQPVLRDSPSKRASYVERSPIMIQKPLEAESGDMMFDSTARAMEREREREKERERERERARERERHREREREKERIERHEREQSRRREREREQAERRLERERHREREKEKEQAERDARGRRSPTKPSRAYVSRSTTGNQAVAGQTTGTRGLQPLPIDAMRPTTPITSPSGLTDNWSPVAANPPSHPGSKRGSMSSSSDDGPEELEGVAPRVSDRARELTKLKDDAPNSPAGKETRRRRSKARQSSVHDLVDLWGGGPQQEKLPVATKLADKRRSAIVSSSMMSSSPSMKPPAVSQSRSSSPQPPLVPSTATGTQSSPPSTAPSIQSRALPKPPSMQQQYRAPPPSASSRIHTLPPASKPAVSSNTTGRSRPQSMFINPVSRTTTLEPNTSANTSIAPSPTHQAALPPDPRARRASRSGRRTSISDMVNKYEHIQHTGTGRAGSTAPPPIGTKPTALATKIASSTSSNNEVPSPGTTATRFPQISPTSSPTVAKASLAVPDEPTVLQRDRVRRSPSPTPAAAPGRAVPAYYRPKEHPTGGSVSGFPPQRFQTDQGRIAEPTPTGSQKPIPASPSEDVRSPSPERPYQGVSRLIDRWQRVVDDSSGPNKPLPGPPPKRTVGAGNSLRGR